MDYTDAIHTWFLLIIMCSEQPTTLDMLQVAEPIPIALAIHS